MCMSCQSLLRSLYGSHILWSSGHPSSSSFVRFGKIDYKTMKDRLWPVNYVVILAGSMFICREYTNQTRLSYAYCIQPMGLKLSFLTDMETCGPHTLFELHRYLPNQINRSVLLSIAVMADLYNQGDHALVFSHSRLAYALKMERCIMVVDYECGRGKIDNSSNTLSEATISS